MLGLRPESQLAHWNPPIAEHGLPPPSWAEDVLGIGALLAYDNSAGFAELRAEPCFQT